MTLKAIALGIAITLPAALVAADATWPQFRGPNGSGVSTGVNLPAEFGPDKGLRWTADLPGRGLSCPSIAGGKVFLTANSGLDQSRLHVLALDASTGKQLWQRQFWATGQTLCHELTCMACPTVTTDGTGVHALFATGDLVSLTADGDVKWVRSLCGEFPKMANHVGRSSSPVLAGDVLVVLMENQGESLILGIDPKSGATRWKTNRPTQNNWNTPIVMNRGDKTEVIVASYEDVTAYDAATGSVTWTLAEKCNPIVSPIVAGDLVLVPSRGLIALKPGNGAVDVKWREKDLSADSPTPLVDGDKIYTLNKNILKCGNLADGKKIWDLRVKGPSHWASPIMVDGKLYLTTAEGIMQVVEPGAEPKIVATVDFKEPILATPAVAGGAMFVRSDKHLWCVGSKN